MRFTATVKNGEVVIRDVQLPDGDTVDVTIEEHVDEDGLTDQDWREIDQAREEMAAGKWRLLDDVLAEIRHSRELRDQNGQAGRSENRSRDEALGVARSRPKPAARRARSGKLAVRAISVCRYADAPTTERLSVATRAHTVRSLLRSKRA